MTSASFNLDKFPGTFANAILLLQDAEGYSFVIEIIDKNVYEFTICIFDKEETLNRTEYILHCDKKGLRDLRKCLDTALNK